MADGAVNFLLEKLTTILLQKTSLLGDSHNEVTQIKFELESMRSFLRDAERSKEKSESVEAWVRQVREVAYEVEDIIDEFMYLKAQGRHKNGLSGVIQGIFKYPGSIISSGRISSKLQNVKAKVLETSERSKRYGFDKVDESSMKRTYDRGEYCGESSAFIDEDEIVGMGDSMDQLMRWLAADEPRRTIISVVGMGGLGKTTLVTKVYNDQIIKKRFDCCAWISVSQTYGTSELLKRMIKDFFGGNQTTIPNNLGSMSYRQLVESLIGFLHQRRYLVVLDDVWSIDFWSRIRAAFPNNTFRSRVVLTTRDRNVAASVGIGSRIHHLEPLQENDAWILFCKKAFWDDPSHSCPVELQPLARAILMKCEGLPLAVVAVGGLMSSKSTTVVEWKKVYESLTWQISNNPVLERVKRILLLSFKELPFYLKHCFLYCCVFRDGYSIKRKKLIRLWVAEGFVVERKGMSIEEVAEDYLRELILRSMIHVTETNDSGRVKTCRVHDVMRELAKTTSEKENFCAAAYDGFEPKIDEKVQRLSVYSGGEYIRLGKTTSRNLRSFFVFKKDTCSSFSLTKLLSKFKLLRVLDLQGVPIETIPSSLVCLFHLRYLNLRDTSIRALPKSMEKLVNLETLDVRNTSLQRLPYGITKLQKLRHLFVYHSIDHRSGGNDNAHTVQIPATICKIRSLQTLACVDANEEFVIQVKNLTDLKRLEITNLEAKDGKKLCASIQKMTSLHRLGVVAAEHEELQLDELTLPPSFLQKLTLVGRLKRLPNWFKSLSNLTHLSLRLSCLGVDTFDSLSQLPSLVFLELNKAYDGNNLNFKTGWFTRLEKLNFLELKQLDSLCIEEGALPSIKELYLYRCQEMKMLPRGIEYLTSLRKLRLEDMTREFVQRIQSGTREDQAKLQHVPEVKLVMSGRTDLNC